MAFFCFDCVEEVTSTSYFTIAIQCFTVLIAFLAFRVANNNLIGVQRSQALNAQMSIIGLEKEITTNRIKLKNAISIYSNYLPSQAEGNTQEMQRMKNDIQEFFELYTSTADKLAALLNSTYLNTQFANRDWKSEYKDLFSEVRQVFDGELTANKIGISITNIDMILNSWKDN